MYGFTILVVDSNANKLLSAIGSSDIRYHSLYLHFCACILLLFLFSLSESV